MSSSVENLLRSQRAIRNTALQKHRAWQRPVPQATCVVTILHMRTGIYLSLLREIENLEACDQRLCLLRVVFCSQDGTPNAGRGDPLHPLKVDGRWKGRGMTSLCNKPFYNEHQSTHKERVLMRQLLPNTIALGGLSSKHINSDRNILRPRFNCNIQLAQLLELGIRYLSLS